jgi:hypothetical protein
MSENARRAVYGTCSEPVVFLYLHGLRTEGADLAEICAVMR